MPVSAVMKVRVSATALTTKKRERESVCELKRMTQVANLVGGERAIDRLRDRLECERWSNSVDEKGDEGTK